MQKPAQNKPKHTQSFIAKPVRPKLPSPPRPYQTTFYFAQSLEVHNIFDTIFFIAHSELAGRQLFVITFILLSHFLH